MKPLMRALAYMKAYWPMALGALAALLLVTLITLVTPQLIRALIDNGISKGNETYVLWMSAALIGVAIFRGIFTFAQGFLSEKVSQSVAYDFRNNLFAKFQSLSFSYYDQAQTGQLMTRATNDVELVRQFISQGFLQLVSSIAMPVGSAITLLLTNWVLSLIALSIVPIMGVVIFSFVRNVVPRFGRLQQKLGALNTVLQENLVGVRVVKAFNRGPYEVERFNAANDALLTE